MANNPTIYDISTTGEIFKWAQGKQDQINRAFRMKGGWEGWLQVELALWLEGKPETASVVREQHVYSSSSQAVDLLVTSKSGTRHMIELKCESVNQDCNLEGGKPVLKNGIPVAKNAFRDSTSRAGPKIPSMAKRLEDEVHRSDNVAAAYRPCQYTTIGISLTKEAFDFVNTEKDKDARYFMPITSQKVKGSHADPDDTFVLWFKSFVVY